MDADHCQTAAHSQTKPSNVGHESTNRLHPHPPSPFSISVSQHEYTQIKVTLGSQSPTFRSCVGARINSGTRQLAHTPQVILAINKIAF